MSNGLRSARRALHGGSAAFTAKFQKHQQEGPTITPAAGPLAVEAALRAVEAALRSAKKAMKRRLTSLRRRVTGSGEV